MIKWNLATCPLFHAQYVLFKRQTIPSIQCILFQGCKHNYFTKNGSDCSSILSGNVTASQVIRTGVALAIIAPRLNLQYIVMLLGFPSCLATLGTWGFTDIVAITVKSMKKNYPRILWLNALCTNNHVFKVPFQSLQIGLVNACSCYGSSVVISQKL